MKRVEIDRDLCRVEIDLDLSRKYRPLALARLYGETVNLGYLSANLWEKVSFGESLEGNSISSNEGDSLAEKYFLPNLWKKVSFAESLEGRISKGSFLPKIRRKILSSKNLAKDTFLPKNCPHRFYTYNT